jgi:rod shape-determining protein MreD
MMKRLAPIIVGVVLAGLAQAGIAPYLAIEGVTPNFLLLVVVTLALTEGPTPGASSGFFAGLLFDLLGTGPVGPMALVLAVTGYLAGLLHSQMFAEGWLLPLTVLGISALGTEIAYGLLLGMLGEGAPLFGSLLTVMFPGAVYNTVLALLIYPLLARFLRRERPMTTFRRLA